MRFIVSVLFVLVATAADAATYYVRTDGSNSNSGLTNSAGGAWRTIDFAASNTVVAGDTIRVQAGNYVEAVSPSRNGSSGAGNTITFVADGVVQVCGADFSNASYQRWIGFTFNGDLASCPTRSRLVTFGGASSYVELWHNTFQSNSNGAGGTDGIVNCCDFVLSDGTFDTIDNSILIGNRLQNINSVIGGGSVGISLTGNHLLRAYNEFSGISCDANGIFGTYHYLLNEYTHDMLDGTCHSDYAQFGSHPLGLSYILIEGLFQVGTPHPDGTGASCGVDNPGCNEHTTIIQNNQPERCTGGVEGGCGAVTEIMVRRNVVHNIGSGSWSMAIGSPQMTRFRMLHNDDVNINQSQTYGNGNVCCAWYHAADVDFVWILHNLEVEAWTPASGGNNRIVYGNEATNNVINRNLSHDRDETGPFGAPWTSQATKQTDVDPLFTDYANDDFTLTSSSPARDYGSSLCLTNGGGTGTTVTLDPNCTGFFRAPDSGLTQYGGNLTKGDTIRIGTDVATVVGISGNTVTLDQSITWVDNDPVYLGADDTPDIGAYPYKASGYTLSATYACGGGACTVTPNDASLVRFVVCFNDNVPYAVVNAAPFTCNTPSGAFVARAYPLYASKTLWATATPGGAPSPPSTFRHLRIR